MRRQEGLVVWKERLAKKGRARHLEREVGKERLAGKKWVTDLAPFGAVRGAVLARSFDFVSLAPFGAVRGAAASFSVAPAARMVVVGLKFEFAFENVHPSPLIISFQ